jgi:methoxymalonate biosynthesis acyl carrier protein
VTDQLAEQTVEQQLVRFLESRTKQQVTVDQDLFASGLVSSMFAMELVVHLEGAHGVAIVGQDLKLENFRTVEKMAALVRRLQDNPTSGGRG